MKHKQKKSAYSWSVFLMIFITAIVLGNQGLIYSAELKPERTKLNLGLSASSASFFPNHVAERQGFFKEEGLSRVKIFTFKGNAPTVQALAGGTIDLCVASLHGLVNAITARQEFRAFWAGYNMTIFEWYAQPKFSSISDTRGGIYGVSKFGSLTDSLTRYILNKADLNPQRDVRILQSGNSGTIYSALKSGQLDVGILSSFWALKAKEDAFTMLLSQSKDIAPDYPTHVVYAKESFIEKNPNTLKAYIRATSRAMEWIKANPEEAAKMLEKQYKFDAKYSAATIDSLKDGWYPDGRLPKEGMKVFWEIAVSIGDAKEVWPNSNWLDDTFLKTQDQWRK
jgi:NitT/TauT family transport system substrate-binding protein